MGSAISKDVPPYVIINGNPAHPHGLNQEGLKRKGFSKQSLKHLRDAYKLVYRSGLTVEEVLPKLEQLATSCEEVVLFMDFIKSSTRGIIR